MKDRKHKHTPGPWTIDAGEGLSVLNADLDDPKIVAYGYGDADIMMVANGDEVAASDMETARANARLIAAAPELLDACRKAINTLNGCEPGFEGLHFEYYRYDPPAIDALEAILAKAIAKADP